MSQINYQAILDTYRQLHQQANAANEQRYQQIIGELQATNSRVGQTYDDAMGLLSTLGDSERERIDMGKVRQQGQTEQDLISRGLGNTTIRQSALRGVEDDAQRAHQSVTEQVGRQQAGMLQARAGAEERGGQFLGSMMERRTDQAPDMNRLTSLLQQAGYADAANGDGKSNVFTGLSANARAGRDAFGNVMGGGGSGGSSGGPSFGERGGGGGGRGGSGAEVIRNSSARSAAGYSGGGFGGAGSAGGGGGAASTAGGGGGNAFDNMFLGQDVYSGGGTIGQYSGDGSVMLNEGQNLLGLDGEIDSNRISTEQGGTADTGSGDAVKKCIQDGLRQAGDFCMDGCRKRIRERCEGGG